MDLIILLKLRLIEHNVYCKVKILENKSVLAQTREMSRSQILPLTTSYQYFCFSTINVHFCHIFSFVSKTGKHDNYFNLSKQLLFAGQVLPGKSGKHGKYGKHGKSGQIYGGFVQNI